MKCCLILALLAPSLVQAGEPVHVRMAQCGGMTKALLVHSRSEANSQKMAKYVALWKEAAEAEAGRDMTRDIDEVAQSWVGRGPEVVRSLIFKDWMKYCAGLARKYGLSERAEKIKRGG